MIELTLSRPPPAVRIYGGIPDGSERWGWVKQVSLPTALQPRAPSGSSIPFAARARLLGGAPGTSRLD